ncbi:MAG: hypothetical protein N2380_06850 [bacterium]|nr:hypothetical protein [bacterium]
MRLALSLNMYYPTDEIALFPMVGEGNRFKGYNFPILSKGSKIPSGGFGFRVGFPLFKEDVKSGLFRDLIHMYRTLRGVKPDIVISVGDPFNLIFTYLGTRRKVFFVSTDQGHSAWVNGFSNLELNIIKHFSSWVFTRDRKTEEFLRSKGLNNVIYLGNPLMDCVDEPRFLLEEGITLLPGTRRDCGNNLLFLLEVIKKIERPFKYYVPVNVNSEPFILESLKEEGYKLLLWDYGYKVEEPFKIYIGRGIFSEMVSSSILVLGLSGSGNEQSAGLGKPVISFFIEGIQFNRRFIDEQKRLLGDALILTDKDSADELIYNLLSNPDELKRRGDVGRLRMGERGAIPRIARFIKDYL